MLVRSVFSLVTLMRISVVLVSRTGYTGKGMGDTREWERAVPSVGNPTKWAMDGLCNVVVCDPV